MRRVKGRSFKITSNQAKGYGYAKPAYRRNPGVTTIAAINGRGSYAGSRSARSVMSKLKRNARRPAARKALTAAQKRAFKARMASARMRSNRSTSGTQSAASKRNIKKAQGARRAWGRKLKRGKRVRVGRASYGRKPKARRLKAGVYIANRRPALAAGSRAEARYYGTSPEVISRLRKAGVDSQKPRKRKARKPRKAGSKTMAKRRRKSATGASKKRRRSSKRRRKTSTLKAAPKRRRRRKARKASGAKRRSTRKGSARRRRKSRKTASAAPRRRRRKARKGSARRRRRSSAAAPRRRRRKARKGSARRRKGTRRKTGSRRRKSRKGSPRRRRSSSRRRRTSRKVASHMQAAGKRGQYKLNRRRRHRRNGSRLFRKNGAMDYVKMGAILLAGFALHRVTASVIANKLLPAIMPAPAAPAATSGFDSTNLKGLLVNISVGALTGFVASKAIKNAETKKLIIGGIAVSVLQTLVTAALQKVFPAGADMLAGPEDGTAARISAMYGMRGLGAGASIMPRYEAIGEYFREPMNGVGEYFREPMNGLGEYISATNGLGTYEQNGDLYQAAAGMGSHDYNGNHIDPSGDLDRQLTIAEAAAGVGALAPFEAAAGIGPMQAAAGFGAINTVPSADTWIPGSADGQLWAGVRAVTERQSATEMVPAGTLQTDGGQGIFG